MSPRAYAAAQRMAADPRTPQHERENARRRCQEHKARLQQARPAPPPPRPEPKVWTPGQPPPEGFTWERVHDIMRETAPPPFPEIRFSVNAEEFMRSMRDMEEGMRDFKRQMAERQRQRGAEIVEEIIREHQRRQPSRGTR